MNWTSTELVLKHGPEIVSELNKVGGPMPKVMEWYVHPFWITGTKTMGDVRKDILSSYNWKSNVREFAEKWSRDGECVYLYRGEDDDCPYEWKTSWTFQPSAALGFIYNKVSGRMDKKPTKVVRKLKVPLSIIDTFGIWAMPGAAEVFLDPQHINFRDLYEDVETYTEGECVDRNYHYLDRRYDFYFDLPLVTLNKFNEYPFNLTYPAYPQREEVPLNSQWCFRTLRYVK